MPNYITPFTGSYPYGKVLQVTMPASYDVGSKRYLFTQWEDGSANLQRIITVNGPISAVATYVELAPFILTVLAAPGGTTTPAVGQYPYYEGTVNVTAFPDADHDFLGWIVDDISVGGGTTYTITMNSNHKIQPIFALKTITLIATATAGGTITPSGSLALQVTQIYTFTADPQQYGEPGVPYPGYFLDHWDLGGVNLGKDLTLAYTAQLADNGKTLTAVFGTTDWPDSTIIVAITGTGTTNPTPGPHTFNQNDPTPVTFTATDVAGSGYTFSHWNYRGNDYYSTILSLLVTAADNGQTATAVFVPIQYPVTVSAKATDGTPLAVTITVTELS